jgi:hypothetical protein
MVGVACVALGGCAGHKERLAKCSADESPVTATAFSEEQKTENAGVIVVQQMADECGPMRPVNQF